tara:strand:- start:396 stop:581 length:186 start_codon:yes stop_codon:yes gene_type:complete
MPGRKYGMKKKAAKKPKKHSVKKVVKPKDGHGGGNGKKQVMQYGQKMMEFGKKMLDYGRKM